ncbi:MAG TPA: Do family serine endopeptidase, partial [Burkholderiaceae bacterium]
LAVGTASAIELPTWLKPKSDQAVASNAANPVAASEAAAMAPVPMLAPQGVPHYRAIVKQSGPAVVGVTVAGTHKETAEESGMPPGMEDDPFFKFFRGMPGFQQRGQHGGQVPFKGLGSGFIISADGLILTNAHVVREAKDVTVKLSDRREFTAKVLGLDPTTDIAVLKIDATGLPVVRLGDARSLEVGDPVLAIGAPYGFEQTATQGIVSAKGRSLPGDAVVPFIQTDAAVNPGNSGGPLFDGTGGVVGINAQIYSQSGGFQGLSFSIPINVALKIKDQIVSTGKVTHARLGVTIQDLNQSLAESFGMKKPDGALVASVAPNSAAAAAGLKSGDVITAVNGQPVVRSGEVSSLIGLSAPGDRVKLQVWRDHEPREVEAKLANADTDKTEVASAGNDLKPGQLGLGLRPLTRDERQQVGVDQGMVIENVAGPAARAGIQAGDVLLAINGKPVQSLDQVKSVLAGKPKSVALLVQRDGDKIFVPVKLG